MRRLVSSFDGLNESYLGWMREDGCILDTMLVQASTRVWASQLYAGTMHHGELYFSLASSYEDNTPTGLIWVSIDEDTHILFRYCSPFGEESHYTARVDDAVDVLEVVLIRMMCELDLPVVG